MLYSEFLKGTRAPETPDTYDQFQIMESIALAVGSTVPEVFYTPLTAEEKEEMEHLGDEVDNG